MCFLTQCVACSEHSMPILNTTAAVAQDVTSLRIFFGGGGGVACVRAYLCTCVCVCVCMCVCVCVCVYARARVPK